MSIAAKLDSLGVSLPDAPAPAANYVPFVRVGNIVYVSGQISKADDLITGKLGDDMDVDAGAAAAQSLRHQPAWLRSKRLVVATSKSWCA